jgi:hypothetical protein
MFTGLPSSAGLFMGHLLGGEIYTWCIAIFAISVMALVEYWQQRTRIRQWISSMHPAIRWSIYISALIVITGLGQFETQTQFIYFQF